MSAPPIHMAPMTEDQPIDIPHKLGREKARERIRSRIGSLASHIPGGAADVEHSWTSEDEMTLNVAAMGQQVRTRLLVEENRIRLYLQLPGMLQFIRPAVEKALRARGAQLLEDKTT